MRELGAAITRDIFTENPNVRWEDISGLYQVGGLHNLCQICPTSRLLSIYLLEGSKCFPPGSLLPGLRPSTFLRRLWCNPSSTRSSSRAFWRLGRAYCYTARAGLGRPCLPRLSPLSARRRSCEAGGGCDSIHMSMKANHGHIGYLRMPHAGAL